LYSSNELLYELAGKKREVTQWENIIASHKPKRLIRKENSEIHEKKNQASAPALVSPSTGEILNRSVVIKKLSSFRI
jgi:hypothetical protein